MVQHHKTPLQHNSSLFISPQMMTRKQDVFITPPNPQSNLFESPGSLLSLFYNIDNVSEPLRNNAAQGTAAAAEEPISRVQKLRLWRHEAFLQHQYLTAEYIGDKILSMTSDPNDAFWLAQVYFQTGNYLRVKSLLTTSPEYEQSVACRYLMAHSLIKLERWEDALDVLGETNPFLKESHQRPKITEYGVRFEASMCYLRGLIYANQNNYERAKDAYKEAVMVDVKCYEAFDELIKNDYLTPAEQWEFINYLNYSDADDNDELVKLLYTSRLSKYINVPKFEEAENILKDEYRLNSNNDLLLSRAQHAFVQCNFDQCLEICETILDKDPYNCNTLPYYISCLYELGGRNKLFLKAHQLAESHPTHPIAWQAIGIYYLSIKKVIEARKFLSKATLLNPNNGQAWIGFAHTFAMDGEHEQAISAYAFAARLFPGNHMPNMFLGMQHLQMNNVSLAEEYLLASHHICNSDPLLLNEIGVVYYHKNQLDRAEAYLQDALTAARFLNSESKIWISINANLGHVYRRAAQYDKALDCFNQALKMNHKNDGTILSAIGLVYLKINNPFKAIGLFHDALALAPDDPISNDLLKRALEANRDAHSAFSVYAGGNITDSHTLSASTSTQSKTYEPLRSFNPSKVGSSKIATVFEDESRDRRRDRSNDDASIAALAERLKEGEESSDEEVMDIESD